MLIHPQFDPIAFSLGPVAVRWYGIMYVVAFMLFMALGRMHLKRRPDLGFSREAMDDLLFYGMLGVILGGRLGFVLFYKPMYYLQHPIEIFYIWQGGMAFHGGFLGVLVAMWLFARKTERSFWQVTDFIAPLVPTGLAAGRMGNFINGELPGRVTDASVWPWAMWFPQTDLTPVARHPSQLYQFALEGLLLFAVLWIFSRKPRPMAAVSGVFLIGYGLCRFLAEFAREPDSFLGTLALGMSMGQWLSWPMIAAGIVVLAWAYRSSRKDGSQGKSSGKKA
ncbi:MAG: prolipoprotein diacylglyceryl transferase [Betaproteobacteria bacterium]